MGDDPMHQMMRQIMALFDEYQSKENAKHVLRAMNENARQGFWNGARPPIGYRIVAAEQRGSKIKKKLEIDPLHADTVRLIYRLFLEGDGTSGAMGVKAIAAYLKERRFFTRDGGRWAGANPRHPDLHHLYRRAQVQHPLAQEPGEKAGERGRHHGGAALDRARDLRCGASPPQIPQSHGDAGARLQRPDAAYRHLLLRQMRGSDDASHWPRQYGSDQIALDSSGNQGVSPDMLKAFGYRRDHLRALVQRVEVADDEVRIMGSKSELLRTLVAASSVETAAFGVQNSVRNGAPDRIRTCDLRLRRPTLYPAELRVHSVFR